MLALDITAKHADDFIGELTEESYRETLWDHKPITDFWRIAHGQCYNQLTGPVTKIDVFWHNLQLGQVCIDFDDIYEVIA